MSPKGYRLIFASHTFTSSHSGFSKGNLGLYVQKSVCNKNQKINKNTSAVAKAQQLNRGLLI